MSAAATRTAAAAVRLRVRLLGGFRVTGSAATDPPDVEWRPRAATLVKLLALSPRRSLHKEQVQELLWPDASPESAANNLRQVVFVARRTLDLVTPGGGGLLLLQGPLLALAPDAVWVDADAFEAAAAQAAHTGDPADYRAAADLYQGDLLPEDRYEDWAAPRREALRQRFLDLLLAAARLHAARGDQAAALAALQRAVLHEPAHEEAHAELMRLHAAAGDRPAAMRQFAQLRATLRRHLDAEPDAATHQLYKAILAHQPLPDPPRAGVDGARGSGGASAAPAAAERVDRSAAIDGATGRWPVSPERGPAAPSHNLPVPLTSFVGRDRERAEVRRLLEGAEAGQAIRLLTLTGAGGTGKTRLALAAAGDLAERAAEPFPDGVWLAALAALDDPALVPCAVAAAVGVREEAGCPLPDTLAAALRPRRLLLVLDNCEHLVEACARLVDVLLGTCPHLRVLATSREALRVPGERVWPVLPLGLPDPHAPETPERLAASEAVALFVERARVARPGFDLTPENAAAVAEVCRRLDGLPLAIELAAARVRVLSVEQIAGRLEDRFRLLTSGARTALPHHQTLRAAVDWSYDRLSKDEQRLFRRLGVFAQGCTLEAAARVAGDEPPRAQGLPGDELDVLDTLARLVDKSLLSQEAGPAGESRFVMLQTVRAYALERLHESGEAAAIQEQHLACYLELAEQAAPQLRAQEQLTWLARLEREYGNLRAALEYAAATPAEAQRGLRLGIALGWFWYLRGLRSEGHAHLVGLLERAGDADVRASGPSLPVRAIAHGVAAHLALWSAGARTAVPLAEEGCRLARESGDPAAIAWTLLYRGLVEPGRSDREQAEARWRQCLALFRPAGDDWGAALSLSWLGHFAFRKGDPPQAIEHLEESRSLFRRLGDRWGIALSLGRLANIAERQADYAAAEALWEEQQALARQLGSTGTLAGGLNRLAALSLRRGDVSQAAARWDESLALYRAIGERRSTAAPLRQLARLVARRDRDFARAEALLRESLRLWQEYGAVVGPLRGLLAGAEIALLQGQHERAARLLAAVEAAITRRRPALDAVELADVEHEAAGLRRSLADAAGSTAPGPAAGESLSVDEAIASVLAEAIAP